MQSTFGLIDFTGNVQLQVNGDTLPLCFRDLGLQGRSSFFPLLEGTVVSNF